MFLQMFLNPSNIVFVYSRYREERVQTPESLVLQIWGLFRYANYFPGARAWRAELKERGAGFELRERGAGSRLGDSLKRPSTRPFNCPLSLLQTHQLSKNLYSLTSIEISLATACMEDAMIWWWWRLDCELMGLAFVIIGMKYLSINRT